jgi:hypothetical protein
MVASPALRELVLQACGCEFAFSCADEETAALIRSVFGGLLIHPSTSSSACRRYTIAPSSPKGTFKVSDGVNSKSLEDADSLLFHIDKQLTLKLQRQRHDLFFLHAAVVAWEGRVVALPAFSGTGKSTLTLVSLADGFEYLSDELAPIDLGTLTVHPYPHALCLKSPPPLPHTLPAGTLRHGGRFHVPVEALPNVRRGEALPLAAVIFLQRDDNHFDGLRRTSSASAVARLMAHTLNALAHPDCGMDAAVALSRAVPCFELDVRDLRSASAAIKSFLVDGEP